MNNKKKQQDKDLVEAAKYILDVFNRQQNAFMEQIKTLEPLAKGKRVIKKEK